MSIDVIRRPRKRKGTAANTGSQARAPPKLSSDNLDAATAAELGIDIEAEQVFQEGEAESTAATTTKEREDGLESYK